MAASSCERDPPNVQERSNIRKCVSSQLKHHHASPPEPWDWPDVARFCERQARRWLGPGGDAEDAAQEAVMRAWRMRHQCATPSAPWGWLARISQREAMRVAARRRESLLDDEAVTDAAEHTPDLLERLSVQAAVADLTSLDRMLIALRYEHDQTYERIAELAGLPVGTVKVRLHRARLRLRDVLAQDSVRH